MRTSRLLLPLCALALFAACGGDKNYEERRSAPEAAKPLDTTNEQAMKDAPIGAGTPDQGSKPVDMAKAEAGLELAWVWALDLDGGEGLAKATYTYDDNTSEFAVPLKQLSMVGSGRGGWEPKPDVVPGDIPGPKLAVRFKGGPFTEYGGGFGQSFLTVANLPSRPNLAPLLNSRSKEFPADAGGAYDLTGWDGIAIWARRGPDGQSTLRLGLTERNSAEDLNSSALAGEDGVIGVVEGKYCKRWRVCGCSGGTECTNVEPGAATPDYRCVDPSITVLPTGTKDKIAFPPCGQTRCEEANPSLAIAKPDPLYSKVQPDGSYVAKCSLAVTSDGRSDSFCYDPKIDPLPPAKRERCNNPFSYPIKVTTNWQLIKVPFTELRQADESYVADDMDLSSVKQIVVTHGAGWTDFWIANLGFYRKQ